MEGPKTALAGRVGCPSCRYDGGVRSARASHVALRGERAPMALCRPGKMLGQTKWTSCGIHVASSTLGVRGPGQGVESGRHDPTLTGEDGCGVSLQGSPEQYFRYSERQMARYLLQALVLWEGISVEIRIHRKACDKLASVVTVVECSLSGGGGECP